MRRRFVLAFVVLFVLFAIGISISLIFIWRGSSELRDVLAMHQVEELRQELSRSLERSQQDLEVSGTVFANQLDQIIANVEDLDRSVQTCFGCHHEPGLQKKMQAVAERVEVYKDQYSIFITAFLNPERRQQLQFEAAATADEIDAMGDAAGPALQRRTEAATTKVERSWSILIATLVLTFLAAIAISFVLTRSVTRPVERLVEAAARISGGDVDVRIRHSEPRELGTLMDAFNTMSESLASKSRRIEDYVDRLQRLNQNFVALCSDTTAADLFARQVRAIDDLVEVELRGCIVRTGLKDVFLVSLSRRGEFQPEYRAVVSAAKLEGLRADGDAELQVVAEAESDRWPFGAWSAPQELRNYLVRWVDWKGEFQGALLAANRIGGDFEAEDGELMIALGQAIGPALERAGDAKGLQDGMDLPDSVHG